MEEYPLVKIMEGEVFELIPKRKMIVERVRIHYNSARQKYEIIEE